MTAPVVATQADRDLGVVDVVLVIAALALTLLLGAVDLPPMPDP